MAETGGTFLKILEWDSGHFGFKVGRIECPGSDPGELERLLGRARAAGCVLVYWGSEASVEADPAGISRLGGRYVATNLVYARSLPPEEVSGARVKRGEGLVRPYRRKELTEGLRLLALEAGEHSRFRVDPRIGQAAFEGLYTIWIQRSVAGEIADAVLVSGADDFEPEGFITMSVKGGRGEIGLLAVHSAHRGRGIGSALVRAGIEWAAEGGASFIEVVTQLENAAACSLYERAGFRRARTSRLFHFWLQ